MPTAAPSRFTRIQLVAIPSTDQDRSVAFYEMLGFEKRNDGPWGDGHRWVELYPPNAPTGIALVPPGPTHAELRALGVDVDESVARVGAPTRIRIGAVEMAGPVPPMFYFRDPDRNSLLIVQPG